MTEGPSRPAFCGYVAGDWEQVFRTLPRPEMMNLSGLERALTHIAYRYVIMQLWEGQVVKDAEIRRQVEATQRAADSLLDSLSDMNPDERMELLEGAGSCWADTERQLRTLLDATEARRGHMAGRKRSGRRRSVAVSRYVDAVILVWETFTEEQAGYTQDGSYKRQDDEGRALPTERGPFLDFAEAVARPVLGSVFTRSLFVEALKRRQREEKAAR